MKKKVGLILAMLFAISASTLVGCQFGGVSDSGSATSSSQESFNSEAESSASSSQGSSDSSESSSANAYTVTFDTDGGSDVENVTVKEGTTIAKPADPTKAGYTFNGWYAEGAQTAFDFTKSIAENITLTAKWTANDDTFYTVEIYVEAVDGSFDKLSQAEVGNETQLLRYGVTDSQVDITEEANQFVSAKTGFKLDATQSILTGAIKGDASSVFKIYLIRETYTLAFEGVTAEPISVKYGATVDFASLPAIPTQDGKTSAWKLGETTISDDFVWNYTENKTLVATYIGVPRTVTFTVNGATHTTEVVENGYTVSAPSTSPEKTGYKFDGWFASGAESTFDFKTAITADVELTAKFTANTYVLKFDTNGGDEAEQISVTYDSAISNLPTPTKEGHTFVEWQIDGTAISDETVWAYAADKTAVASWQINKYAVTFKVDGVDIPSQSVEYKQTAIAPTVGGYDIAWDFDFATLITEATEISGTAAVKAVKLKDTSKMVISGKPVDVAYREDGAFGLLTLTSTGSDYTITAAWQFDLTSDDIAAFKQMGYTHLDFKLGTAASDATNSSKFVHILNNTKKVDIVYNQWTDVSITLEELQAYIESGETNFIVNGWILYQGTLSVKDVALSVYHTVTFDYAGEQTTVSVLSGGLVTSGVSTVAGYDVNWKLNGETFDFNTPITSNITLTATADDYKLKEVKLSSTSKTYFGTDPWQAVEFEGTKCGQITAAAAGGWQNLDTNWTFDITVADVEAWIEAGYKSLQYTVVYTGGGGAEVTLFDGSKVTAGTTTKSMTLETLKQYITDGTKKFATCDWFSGSVQFYLQDMQLVK